MASGKSSTVQALVASCLVIYGICLIVCADTRIMPGLDADRYALMESVVEHGTACVDASSITSVDRARINGHFYSEKPPLLSFAGAGVYYVLHRALGWNFGNNPAQIVRVMIALFVVLPLCVLLWLFWKMLIRWHFGWQWALAATALPALASLLLPYGVCFTNHPLAGALLFSAFYTGWGLTYTKPGVGHIERTSDGRIYFLVGLFCALSAAVDLLPGAVFFAAFLALGIRRMNIRAAGWMFAGALIPGIVHFLLNRAATGLWMPAYFIHGRNLYEGSIWRADSGMGHDYEPFPNYVSALYHFTIGHRGVFLFMPFMIFGIAYLCQSARSKNRQRSWLALSVLITFIITLAATPAISLGLAGGSYGPRHIVPVIALVYLYAVYEFRQPANLWRRWLAYFLVAWSAAIAWIGALDPWTPGTLSVYAPMDVLAARSAKTAQGWSTFAQEIVDRTAYSRSFAYYELGRIYREQGKVNEAIDAYKYSLRLDPNRPLALFALGSAAGVAGRMPLSIEAFEKLTQIEPDNSGAWANLGMSLLSTDHAIEARTFLEKGLALNPQSRAALTGLAIWHERYGTTETASGDVDRLDMTTSSSRPVAP